VNEIARRRAERGMTLVEALVAVALMGLITGALSMALMVTIGPDQDAGDRLSSARNAQLTTLYLPDDVQSATTVDLAAASTPQCTGTEAGSNVLLLTWTQAVPTSTTYSVSYRTRTVGTERQLVRFACEGTAAPSVIVVARELDDDTPDAAVQVTSSGQRITMRLRSADDVVTTISGVRRTPPNTCTVTSHALSASTAYSNSGTLTSTVTLTVSTQGPCTGLTMRFVGRSGTVAFSGTTATLPSTGWTNGTTYTVQVTDASTGSTVLAEDPFTVEAPPCVASLALSPNPVAMGSPSTLLTNVVGTVTISPTSGTCSALELAYTTPGDSVARVVPVSGSTATIPGSTGSWTAGTVEVSVREISTARVAGSATLTVNAYVPCTVSAVTPNPTSVLLNGTNLAQAVTVTATTSGACSSLELVYKRSTGDTDQVRALTASGTTYSVTIPAASGPWSAGTVSLRVRQVGTTTDLQTGTLTVTAGCAVSSVTPNPASVGRQSNQRLASSVIVTVQTTGPCSGLRLQYFPDADEVIGNLVQQGTSGTWTLTLGNGGGDPKWVTGNHTLTVFPASGTTALATGNLQVT
jgi:hypothetical protein